MSIASNIYAEKVYSEHPISLWTLDDNLDYISFLSDTDRDMTTWQKTQEASIGIIASNDVTITAEDINIGQRLDSGLYKIVSSTDDSDITQFMVKSSVIQNFENFDDNLSTFSIGTYFYSDVEYIKSIRIGYRYIEEVTNQAVYVTKSFDTSVFKNWIYVAETFDIPNYSSDIELILIVEYYYSGDLNDEYTFYVNGMSVGQWSEEFQSESLGISYGNGVIDFPSSIAVNNTNKAVIARAYGLKNDNGYYLADEYKLYAKNTGLPMVYGASNITKIYPNGTNPSLIIPGNGFLNNYGKHSTTSLECWIRINSSSVDDFRIIGPIGSTDGVYVDGERFYLKVSDQIKSVPVAEWGNPTLLAITYTVDKISLMINGDQILSIDINATTTYFPNQKDAYGRDQDWIGFYASDDVSLEIDCIGIYPYEIDKNIAKRRWVYGQNVEYPENLNAAYDGKTVAIDYANANYVSNFVYPKRSRWSDSISENISFINNQISAPAYQLPDIILESGSISSWLYDQSITQYEPENSFVMKPNTNWDGIDGYLYFNNLSFLSEPVQSIYGVFKSLSSSTSEQILFKIRDRITGNYFSISLVQNNVIYKINYNGTSKTIRTLPVAAPGELFIAGINMDTISRYYGEETLAFFSNKKNLEVFIAGDQSYTKTFTGKTYNISLCSPRNSSLVGYMFAEDGIIIDKESFQNVMYDAGYQYFGNSEAYWAAIIDGGDPYSVMSTIFLDHIATYTLKPKEFFGTFLFDVATYSTWENFVPLSTFAKYVKDGQSGTMYDLDFIQFNIGYPSSTKFVQQKSKKSSWTYSELQAKYLNPIEYTYAELDNELFSGYASYDDLRTKTETEYVYDTSNSSVRTYVSFQLLSSGANQSMADLPNTTKVSINNLIVAGDEWVNTKYEVLDGTVIYPPKSIDFNKLAIVTHVEIESKGTRTEPVSIASLELTSQALDVKSASPIGTKFGQSMYPYTKNGIYFNYKETNPFRIHKRNTPYLFLNKKSGIELVGDYQPLTNRGLTIPLNPSKATKFDVAAMQILFKYNQQFFPYSSTPIFELESKGSYIKFYLVATHPTGKRAKIYAINSSTGLEENGIAFYINGKLVKSPTVSIDEWMMLGISFSPKLNLSSFSGAIRINGPIMVNNLSYYQSDGLQQKIYTAYRVWDRVKTSIQDTSIDWQSWRGNILDPLKFSTYTWNNVLVIGYQNSFGINLPEIFKTYIGTNKIIVDDNRKIKFSNYRFRSYNNLVSSAIVKKPS